MPKGTRYCKRARRSRHGSSRHRRVRTRAERRTHRTCRTSQHCCGGIEQPLTARCSRDACSRFAHGLLLGRWPSLGGSTLRSIVAMLPAHLAMFDVQRSCIHVEPTGPAPATTDSGGAPSGTVGNRYGGARRGADARREAPAGRGTTARLRNDGAPQCGFPEGTDGVPRWPAILQGPGGRPRGRRRGPCAPARRATQITLLALWIRLFARRRRIRRKVHDGRPQGPCVNAQLCDNCPSTEKGTRRQQTYSNSTDAAVRRRAKRVG